MATIIKTKNPNKIFNMLATKPMTKSELAKATKMDPPRVSEAIRTLEKYGYTRTIGKITSKRGKQMDLHGLTPQGAINYLSSITILETTQPANNTQPQINQPKIIQQPPSLRPLQKDETIENYLKQQQKEKETYQKELETKVLGFLATYGKLLPFPLFSEIHWLQEKYGNDIFQTLIRQAKILVELKPFPKGGMQLIQDVQKRVNTLRNLKWKVLREESPGDLAEINMEIAEAEEDLSILRSKEDKWWRMGFAARVADQLCGEGRGDMYNEVLADFFAEVAEFFRRLEVEPAEKMTQIFSAT